MCITKALLWYFLKFYPCLTVTIILKKMEVERTERHGKKCKKIFFTTVIAQWQLVNSPTSKLLYQVIIVLFFKITSKSCPNTLFTIGCNQRYWNIILAAIHLTKKHLNSTYGFSADLFLLTWKNVKLPFPICLLSNTSVVQAVWLTVICALWIKHLKVLDLPLVWV